MKKQTVWRGISIGARLHWGDAGKVCVLLAAVWLAGPVGAVVILPENVDWTKNGYEDPLPLQETEWVESPPDRVEQPAEPLVRISLRKPESLGEGFLRLADVADIVCLDPDLWEEIGSIELFPIPDPGQRQYLFPRRVETALRHLGLGSEDFAIEGPDRIPIESPSQTVAMEQVEAAINSALRNRAMSEGPGEVEAFMIHPLGDLRLPPGEVEIEVLDLDRPGSGNRNIQVAFLVNGEKAETRAVPVRANQKIYGLVAARNLTAGRQVREEDLKEGLVPFDGRDTLANTLGEANLLVGAKLKRDVKAESPLVSSDVEWEPLMRQGEHVTLVQAIGKVRLTAPGILMEDLFRVGQSVQVRKANSRRDMMGKAISEGMILVD